MLFVLLIEGDSHRSKNAGFIPLKENIEDCNVKVDIRNVFK